MEKCLQKIKQFYDQKKRMPSYGEILKITRLKSKNSAYRMVEKMIEKGVLEKDEKGKLIPTNFFDALRVLGRIEAGFPSPAEEELIDTMTLDQYLIEKKEATYMLTVSGDSMKDAGIMEGDLVLVERGRNPKAGDIVVAQVDGKWTMKYLRVKNRKFYLEPANKKYKPIFPKEEMKIEAVVRAVVRKY